ncbi:MAG: peptide deformylase, partial [Thermoleophilaceae bacterium]|nr:peptide deformylase [Thermoleophilaceae bacterium]
MPVRKVLLYPDPILKKVAAPAPEGEELARVVDDLIQTMRSFPGCVGLAAPQIGELVRVAAIDLSAHKKAPPNVHGLLVLIDPVVQSSAGSEVAREGCLSIPQLTANVRRATEITVTTRDGSYDFADFEARCVLHELDHLDGLLFLDRVDSLTADIFARKPR